MKTSKPFLIASRSFILLSALSLFSVSLMAFVNPQSVMDLVHVQLNNTDAFSSIRGIYGGVGMALTITLLYFMIKDVEKALAFLSLLWGFYALSRTLTIFMEGALGEFGKQWLIIETLFFFIALTLLIILRKKVTARQVIDTRIAA